MGVPSQIIAVLILLFSTAAVLSDAEEPFDVRRHLSTATRYHVSKDISENSFVPSKIGDQCKPIHLNLVARHGTRAPTKKRLKELEAFASRLELLLENVKEKKSSVKKIPAWFWGWKSPWIGKHKGGELISEGENEMYQLGIRTRENFPELFQEDYHPDIYPIKATQVSRASASAVAFGMGLFSDRGSLGPGRHRAFAVISESRASDTMLRFHDCCQNYKSFRKSQEPFVDKLKEPVLNEITQELGTRWGLNFTRQDVSTLWFLCKQEASLLNTTDRACALFSPSEVGLMEWTDDLEVFILKGYAGLVPGSYEMATLRFAHAETLLPFSCLIGLFLDGSGECFHFEIFSVLSWLFSLAVPACKSILRLFLLSFTEFEQILREQPLQLPPKPPQKRTWHGSTVAPFAGNNMLVLHSCPANNSSKYFVQVLHNEHPIPMPGCGNSDFCPFEVFKEKIAAPHLKHNYNDLCSTQPKQSDGVSSMSKLSQIFSWIFPAAADAIPSQKAEL
ncbi:hypothetical protein ACJIZ3_009548 [Penstemon smallii]|uniref:Multiple inositol polyphosphate phosphatase 1 n=1 Tax=Penstemon smallii TaxID=265156 RepID=A0ABD3TCU0_9LAMI